MLDINQIKEELEKNFPQYQFSTTRRLTGRCIVAKQSKYYGADIFIKNDRIIVEPAIPEWTTRLILGAGAAHKKLTDKTFSETAIKIKDFLGKSYKVDLKS